jgi:FKBP-type peptidyl-prolyl cis-trans isomerase FkpA
MRLSHLVLGLALIFTMACGGGNTATETSSAVPPPPAAFAQSDLTMGSGSLAGKGARITVNYTGWIYDASKPDNKGAQFDTSIGRGPFSFTLGTGDVIPGWDRGFDAMRVGGKRRLIIPPALGYGAEGTPGGPIPPNAGLVFEMELLDVK